MNDGENPGRETEHAATSPAMAASVRQARQAIVDRVSPGLVVDVDPRDATFGTSLADAGYTYVAIGDDAVSMQRLQRQGLHAVQIDLADLEHLRVRLAELGQIRAFCLLNAIDRLPVPDRLLRFLSEYATARGDVSLIVTAPNAGHRDDVLRLLAGYLPNDADDATSPGARARVFTGRHLSALFERCAWRLLERYDLERAPSEQPPAPSVLLGPTLVGDFVRHVGSLFNPDSRIDHFVWVLEPSGATPADVASRASASPLVSMLVRTQGRRNELLIETLSSIAAQTCEEYEVVVCFHNPDGAVGEHKAGVERIVSQFYEPLRGRIRLIETREHGRGAPLNALLDSAAGVYLSFLDDDDLLFDHHVETIKRGIETHGAGVLFQTFAAQRLLAPADRPSSSGAEPTAAYPYTVVAMSVPWAQPLDPIQQHHENMVPICSLAIPVALVRQTTLRFRTDIEVGEDWVFWMEALQLLRVVVLPEVTAAVNHWNDLVSNAMRRPDLAPLWRSLRDVRHAEAADVPLLLDGQVRRRLMEYGRQAEELARLREQLAAREARIASIYTSRLWRVGRTVWWARRTLRQMATRLRAVVLASPGV